MTTVIFADLIYRCSTEASRELRVNIDMDAEKGQAPRPGRDNHVRVVIKPTGQINMAVISAYLSRTVAFDNSILQAISKL